MTREELKEHCKRQVQRFERVEKLMTVTPNDWKRYEEHKLILELLEQEPCEDAISRQEVLRLLANSIGKTNTYLQTKVLKMPSVTPQEPIKGRWISHIEHCEMNNLRPSGLGSYFWCSECDCGIDSKNFSRVNYNYCPNCGADMRGDKE